MSQLKTFLFFLIVSLSAFKAPNNTLHVTKWIITKGGLLKVEGSTNINTFNCVINNYLSPDTLIFSKLGFKGSLQLSGCLQLNVNDFDCHNVMMTKDLRKTLKAKYFPKLMIRFISLDRYPDFDQKSDSIKGIVTIELAGITKRFEIDYKVISDGTDSFKLIGSRQVNFSDFNIVPPRKIGGMIQTKNELDVEFYFKRECFKLII